MKTSVAPVGQALILLENFDSGGSVLKFSDFQIFQVTSSNWDEVKEWFRPTFVSRQGTDYILHKIAPILPHGNDIVGLGGLPYESEDLMLLLRLFRVGDLRFNAQIFRNAEGELLRQFAYPPVISEGPSSQKYKFGASDIPNFEAFAKQMRSGPGWSSSWFRVARRYFLWGGSKEFNCVRDHPATWELERVLDYMVALEATLVPEKDFVSRRLRERGASILTTDLAEREVIRKRLRDFYEIRSRLAHGDGANGSMQATLGGMGEFERDIRGILAYGLSHFPADSEERNAALRAHFDIDDTDRARKVCDDFHHIKDEGAKESLVAHLGKLAGPGKSA
jgi:hypothetical protein